MISDLIAVAVSDDEAESDATAVVGGGGVMRRAFDYGGRKWQQIRQ